jgi:enoyl-CoA hydratase
VTVHVEASGLVRVVTIDNPERRNALDASTMEGLGAAFTDAASDAGVRVVVLTAVGDRAFCAGMDLRSFASGESGAPRGPGTEVFAERYYPKPIVAAVNGAAVGGGLGIMLACDVIVAVDEARFGLPEVQRGLIGAGSGSRVALRLPPAVAMELALTGELIDARRAYELGMVNRVVARPDLMPVAMSIAERIAANGPIAVRATKEMVYDIAALGQVDMPVLRAKVAHVRASADAKEGARAFSEHRAPVFRDE